MRRVSVGRFDRQFCFLPTIGILHHLRGMYNTRIAAMWLCWGISIGIRKNHHSAEDSILRRKWERENRHDG